MKTKVIYKYVYCIIQVAIHTHPSNPYTGARARYARYIVHLPLHIFDFSHIKPCAMCTRIFAHLTLRARSFLAHVTPKFSIFFIWRKTPLSVCGPPPSPYRTMCIVSLYVLWCKYTLYIIWPCLSCLKADFCVKSWWFLFLHIPYPLLSFNVFRLNS